MGTSRILRIVTWLVVMAIVLSTASPVLAFQGYANREGDSLPLAATVQAALSSLTPQPLAEPAQRVGALPGAAAGYFAGSIIGSVVYDKVTTVAGWFQ